MSEVRRGRLPTKSKVYSQPFSRYVYCRELSEVEAKLDAMEENSRQMTILQRQQMEAQALVDRAKHELNEAELIRDIDRAKFVSLFSSTYVNWKPIECYFKFRSEKVIQEAELDHCRSQLKKVMSQRDIRVKLEMHQKYLSSKRTQERRLMVKRFKNVY